MVKHKFHDQNVRFCDITGVPTTTCIPVTVDKSLYGRETIYVCDRSVAKIVGDPNEADGEAGIIVPAAPSVNSLDYLCPRKQNTMTAYAYLAAIDEAWQKAKASDYEFVAIIIQPSGYGVPVHEFSAKLLFRAQKQAVVASDAATDQKLVMHYNTIACSSPSGQLDEINNRATAILSQQKSADVVVGNALLVRMSMAHDAPLGLDPRKLVSMLGRELAPSSTTGRKRACDVMAPDSKKRSRKAKAKEAAVDIPPLTNELQVIRVGTHTVNACSEALIRRDHFEEDVSKMLQWEGGLAADIVRREDGIEWLVVLPNLEDESNVSLRRTAPDSSAYKLNSNIIALFPSVDKRLAYGVAVVVARSMAKHDAGEDAWDHLDLNFFLSAAR